MNLAVIDGALPVQLHGVNVERFLLGARGHHEARSLMLRDTFSLVPCSKRSLYVLHTILEFEKQHLCHE